MYLKRGSLFSILTFLLLGAMLATAAEDTVVLKYGDGQSEGKQSIAGGGHATRFQPPQGTWYLIAVELYGARYGYPEAPQENFKVYLCDPSMKQVLAQFEKPYSTFERGEMRWVKMDLPPTPAPPDFCLCFAFNPTQTKGVYVGYDETVNQAHSAVGLPGGRISPLRKTSDWMIRVHLSTSPTGPKPPPLSKETTLLKHDDDSMENKRSLGGSGHVIFYTCPQEGPWFLTQIQVFGSRYGYPQAPQEDFSIYLCDVKFTVLKEFRRPYSLFERGPEKWYQIDLEATEVPPQFYLALNFRPTQTKGVYVGIDENAEKIFSRLGVPGSPLKEIDGKFNWMIRAVLTKGAEGEKDEGKEETEGESGTSRADEQK
jgi:hypothetical protein